MTYTYWEYCFPANFTDAAGGSGVLGGGSRILLGHFHEILNVFLKSRAQAQSIGTLVGCFD